MEPVSWGYYFSNAIRRAGNHCRDEAICRLLLMPSLFNQWRLLLVLRTESRELKYVWRVIGGRFRRQTADVQSMLISSPVTCLVQPSVLGADEYLFKVYRHLGVLCMHWSTSETTPRPCYPLIQYAQCARPPNALI